MSHVTLSDRVQELLDEMHYWLREPPADLPEFSRQLCNSTKRAETADECRRELDDAAALLREHGFMGK